MANWQKDRNVGTNTGGSRWTGNNQYSSGGSSYKKTGSGTTPQNKPAATANDDRKKAWSEAEIGALWQKEGVEGPFFTGTLNGVDVIILKNKNKKESKHPDYRVYIKEKYDALTGFVKKQGAGAGSGQNKPSYNPPQQNNVEKPEFDENFDQEDMDDLVF